MPHFTPSTTPIKQFDIVRHPSNFKGAVMQSPKTKPSHASVARLTELVTESVVASYIHAISARHGHAEAESPAPARLRSAESRRPRLVATPATLAA
jgi:hypothetical protein